MLSSARAAALLLAVASLPSETAAQRLPPSHFRSYEPSIGTGTGAPPAAAVLLPRADDYRYLLSYHVDLGTQDPYLCMNFLPASWCWGHAGDSEDIYLDVVYHWSSQHWVLKTAYYSRHGEYGVYGAGPNGYPNLFYPSHPGAYPRSYVSMYKHANYASQPECDAAQYGFEDCLPNAYARTSSGANLNLGTRSHQRLNCMASSDPLYSGDGRTECYWTGTDFAGWQTFQPSTDPYSPKLSYFGF